MSDVTFGLEWCELLSNGSDIGPGMHNYGNTCFMNATLQCLAHVPPLAQFIMNLGNSVVRNLAAFRKGARICLVRSDYLSGGPATKGKGSYQERVVVLCEHVIFTSVRTFFL